MPRKKTQSTPPPETGTATTAVLEPEQVEILESQELPADWHDLCTDPQIDFFDLLEMLPETAWDDVALYLYRLEPAVQNRSGEKKYIGVYASPQSLESIKQAHGGGKYEAYLKEDQETLRRHKFAIDGPPKLIEGQTYRNPAGQGQVIPPPPSNETLASVVREVISATKGDPSSANAGVEVMRKAFIDSLDIVKTTAAAQIGSETGSKFGDKILEALIPRLLNPPSTPALDPMVTKFMDAAITMFKNQGRENPDKPPATAEDPLKQFTFVKELLGVESLRDLMDLGGRKAEQPWYVPIMLNALDKLPSVIQQYGQMQQEAFQRAFIAHNLTRGGALPAAVPMPGQAVNFSGPIQQPATAAASPIPSPAAAGPGVVSADVKMGMMIEGICQAYDRGYPGDIAAAHLVLSFPQLVDQLKPLLTDPTQLRAFVQQIPPLAERVVEEDWPDFEREFIEELLQPAEPAAPKPPASTPPLAKAAPANGRVA